MARKSTQSQASPLVLALAGEGELVLGLSVGDLVDTEPLVGGTEKAGEVALDILDVVELGRKRVVHIDDDDLPVGLLLVEQGHDAKDLDLLDLAGVANELTDFADVERVVVTLGLGLGVDGVGVLPGLHRRVSQPARYGTGMYSRIYVTHLGECAVVPQVALVGEAVAHISELALLDILLDGVEELILGDLYSNYIDCQYTADCNEEVAWGTRRAED